MTETSILKKVLLQIQDRFKQLRSTNRNRFASLTIDQTFSFQNFMSKLKFFGSDDFEDDLRTIWVSMYITGDSEIC
jgi:hypothetical protein